MTKANKKRNTSKKKQKLEPIVITEAMMEQALPIFEAETRARLEAIVAMENSGDPFVEMLKNLKGKDDGFAEGALGVFDMAKKQLKLLNKE